MMTSDPPASLPADLTTLLGLLPPHKNADRVQILAQVAFDPTQATGFKLLVMGEKGFENRYELLRKCGYRCHLAALFHDKIGDVEIHKVQLLMVKFEDAPAEA